MFLKPAVHEGWGYVDSGFRRKDGGGAGMTEVRGKGLVQMFLKPAVHEGWGYVDSGFRRKDGGGAGMTEVRGKRLVQMFLSKNER